MVQDGERADHQIMQSWLPIAATRRKSRPIQPAAPNCSKSQAIASAWPLR
jgi:hypothetical protein